MNQSHDKYLQRGVSSDKKEVHQAIQNLSKGLYDNTFCKIIENVWEKNSDTALILHADGAGTKSSLAYAYWKETGDMSVWKGIAQDAIVMNLDDMLCCGYSDNFILSSTIGRNKRLIGGDVIAAIIEGTAEFCQTMKEYGIHIEYAGGETADVGDLVRTIIVDSTMAVKIKKKNVINIDIREGDVIVGLASFGQSTYEKEYNSGIGSNGLTMARHDVFNKLVAEKYPETYDDQLDAGIVYTGKHDLSDKISVEWRSSDNKIIKQDVPVGKLVLSPTRTYAPVLADILPKYSKQIRGIIHCTGGGQTKVLHFLKKNLRVIKDNLFPLPPLFHLIYEQNKENLKELYKVFNMGHRLEIYTDIDTANIIINISKNYNLDARIIGKVIASDRPEVFIKSEAGSFVYHL
ncbi:MAG: phosphoribosylformylglycinamidine cyclo-ligase [Bacteroidia bacterium]|nr:MAG: phosphoribosylformylglycinamidine cyclo-ligase [Bacteroidia bacterium]